MIKSIVPSVKYVRYVTGKSYHKKMTKSYLINFNGWKSTVHSIRHIPSKVLQYLIMELLLKHCLDWLWRYTLKIHKRRYIAGHSSEPPFLKQKDGGGSINFKCLSRRWGGGLKIEKKRVEVWCTCRSS